MSDGFYLFLSSTDSSNIYPHNSYKDFWIEFDHTIELEQSCGFGFSQQWRVALTELTIDLKAPDQTTDDKEEQTLPEEIVVLTDLCEPSCIHGTKASILRNISTSSEIGGSLYNTYYIGVVPKSFNRIRIELKNRQLEPLASNKGWTKEGTLKCTLHFTRN